MGDILNLRQARKRKRRAGGERGAEASRVQHGRPKAEKQKNDGLRAIEERRHVAHRREPRADGGD